jgi:hypothetical protein
MKVMSFCSRTRILALFVQMGKLFNEPIFSGFTLYKISSSTLKMGWLVLLSSPKFACPPYSYYMNPFSGELTDEHTLRRL